MRKPRQLPWGFNYGGPRSKSIPIDFSTVLISNLLIAQSWLVIVLAKGYHIMRNTNPTSAPATHGFERPFNFERIVRIYSRFSGRIGLGNAVKHQHSVSDSVARESRAIVQTNDQHCS
jgi:hypothetical protein